VQRIDQVVRIGGYNHTRHSEHGSIRPKRFSVRGYPLCAREPACATKPPLTPWIKLMLSWLQSLESATAGLKAATLHHFITSSRQGQCPNSHQPYRRKQPASASVASARQSPILITLRPAWISMGSSSPDQKLFETRNRDYASKRLAVRRYGGSKAHSHVRPQPPRPAVSATNTLAAWVTNARPCAWGTTHRGIRLSKLSRQGCHPR
jgi:hypothetical protein